MSADGTWNLTMQTPMGERRSTLTLSTAGGAQVETRRFVATAPADGTAATVGPALNRAANQVAAEVAQWVGGPSS